MNRLYSEPGLLAIALRKLQWATDEAAHRIPEDRYSPSELRSLADYMDSVAKRLRSRAATQQDPHDADP